MSDLQLIRELEGIFKATDELDPGWMSGIPVTMRSDGLVHAGPGALEGNPHPVLTCAILCIAGHGLADSVEGSTVSVGRFRVTTDDRGFHSIEVLDDPLTPEEPYWGEESYWGNCASCARDYDRRENGLPCTCIYRCSNPGCKAK